MPVSLFTLYYLYAAFSSRCCHSSELPVALAARATHQSRQPHTPPKKQGHIISQQYLQSLCSPWLKIVQKVRSASHYRRTMPVSLFTLYFLHVAVTAANSQSPWPPEPLISHDSHTPPEETEPHHITAVSPVTLVTLVESCSKGKFGLTLPLNDASFSLYAVLSSHCCHSSELPVALAAKATHQSRQPHAPPKKQSHISLGQRQRQGCCLSR
jgi:hypothetical protein